MDNSAGHDRPGTLYGVGVGPGDPGMVTLRAVEVIKSVSTVAYPVARPGAESRALEVVRRHLNGSQKLLPLTMPMTRDRESLKEARAEALAAITSAAADGDVAYLSLGDPLFYSTFGYLAKDYTGPIEVICGVTSLGAMSAATGLPLADGDTATVVVSGASHEAIRKALEMGSSIVIIKPRALKEESLDLLQESGALSRARAAVELGGSGQEVIETLDRETAAGLPYFSVIWISSE